MNISKESITFDSEKGTLLLHVDEEGLLVPEYVRIYAKNRGLELKREFHITILGYGAGQNIIRKIGAGDGVLDEIEALAKSTDWSFVEQQAFYHIQRSYGKDIKEHRESIISILDVPELGGFVERVGRMTGVPLEVPPAHITLFSKSDNQEKMHDGIGISSEDDLRKASPIQIIEEFKAPKKYKAIALPTRSQPDTIIAIFILKHFGEERFPGIQEAGYIILPRIPDGETEASLAKEGIFLFDVGGGMFDHHTKPYKTTASALIADHLGLKDNPALTKLLQFAERDDFYGKGIISTDPLDRAFGLSGLIGSLNKKYVSKPERVVEIILPIIDAFYAEEAKRAFEMPKELEEKLANGKAHTFFVRQNGKQLKCIFIQTDNTSMAGFLRSKGGGGYDVVALNLSSGHVNILTRPTQSVDLRSLIVLIRIQEGEIKGTPLEGEPETLSVPGTIPVVPEWYYDTATNSLLNGGPNPQNIAPTSIDPFDFHKLLEVGLSEKVWAPRR
ncbi:MAG: hypothetical protein V4465_01200 [Patescibacteria group bacterium]